jgi:hypothetical protein
MMVSPLYSRRHTGRRIDRNQYALGDNYSRVEALEMHIKERAIIAGPQSAVGSSSGEPA